MLLLFFCSCRQEKENTELIEESVRQSTKIIDAQTKSIYKVLEEKAHDPRTAEKMKYWKPRADSLKKYRVESQDIIKLQLESIKEETRAILFSDALMNYRQQILSLATEINRYLATDSFFKTPVTKIKNYSYYENYTSILENKALNFINASSGSIFENFITSAEFLLNQNAIHFKTGDTLEIFAGMGVFSSAPAPRIQIKNKQLQILNGTGSYSFILKEKPGKYTIPVHLNYTNENGENIERIYEVEYFIDK